MNAKPRAAMAHRMVDQIRRMQADGQLPGDISDFGQLHEHFDANVGWGEDIDALGIDDWAAVQDCVNRMLAVK